MVGLSYPSEQLSYELLSVAAMMGKEAISLIPAAVMMIATEGIGAPILAEGLSLDESTMAAEGTLAVDVANLATAPNRIYSARVLIRGAEESGPFHNFPESFNQQIFDEGTRTVTPNFYNVARPGLSSDAVMYEMPGSVNGVGGTFEIGVRPSLSGNTEVIMHRFFQPGP
jgi:hypothetical protein